MSSGGLPCCIVAGVGPGIGLAVARKFAGEGYAVAMLARRTHELAGYADLIASDDGFARGYPADLADTQATQAAIGKTMDDLGSPSILLYNAAIWRAVHPMHISPEQFEHDLKIGVGGALTCAQAVYPAMKAAGQGSIFFTGGGLALSPGMGSEVPSLTAAKSALRGLSFAMAPLLAADGIQAATLTVAGMVADNTPFSAESIAERFWVMHHRNASEWTVEEVIDS